MTWYEKIGLMCTKYIPSCYSTYRTFCISYQSSVNCIKLLIVYCSSCKSFIGQLRLDTKLWNFKVKECGQILCVHKPYFLMPRHIYIHIVHVLWIVCALYRHASSISFVFYLQINNWMLLSIEKVQFAVYNYKSCTCSYKLLFHSFHNIAT